jgi:hypothetical protein
MSTLQKPIITESAPRRAIHYGTKLVSALELGEESAILPKPGKSGRNFGLAQKSEDELNRIKVDDFIISIVAKFLCDLCGRGSGSSRSLEQQIFEH